MKYGTPLRYDTLEAAGQTPDFEALAADAYAAINASGADGRTYEEAAIERVNGMKEEYGTGVSTLVMIYNATGSTLKYDSIEDSSGHLFKYQPDSVVYNGEWSVFLHTKTAGAARGSVATAKYWLRGGVPAKSHQLSVSWSTPWSGTNTASATVYDLAAARKAMASGSMFAMIKQLTSAASQSPFATEVSLSQESSPLVRYVIGRRGVI